MRGAARNQGRTAVAPASALHSRFDPMELLGSDIPFQDPFDYDENDFKESAFVRANSTPLHRLSHTTAAIPASFRETKHTPAVQLPESMPLQRTPSLPPAGPAHRELAVAPDLLGKTNQVAKLSPGQTIHIFKLGKTRTDGTAGLLAVEYGVTVKDIHNIWSLDVALVGQ